MKRKTIWYFLCFFLVLLKTDASQLSFRVYGGMSWADGGDLNRNLRGWKNYFSDRNRNPYFFEYGVEELHRFWESGTEITYFLSSRFRVGLGFEFLVGTTEGEMSSSLELENDYFNSSADFGTIFLEESSLQRPQYRLKALPVTLTFYYSIPFGGKGNIFIGCGGGYYSGRLKYKEDYKYNFDSRDESTISGSLSSFVDLYSTSGIYSEESTCKTLGLHARGGLELKIYKDLHFVFEVLGRRVNFNNWRGSKKDEYSWNHTWGFWGSSTDAGSVEKSVEGKLWMVEYQSEETGKSYSRFVFSEEKPLYSSYLEARPAKISLNGFSLRIGIKISL